MIIVAMLIPTVYKYVWCALIPCVALLLYILIYRPYNFIGENLRASFNVLVICSWLCFSFLAPIYSNKTLIYIVFIVNAFVLLPLVIIISIVSTAYYYYY